MKLTFENFFNPLIRLYGIRSEVHSQMLDGGYSNIWNPPYPVMSDIQKINVSRPFVHEFVVAQIRFEDSHIANCRENIL